VDVTHRKTLEDLVIESYALAREREAAQDGEKLHLSEEIGKCASASSPRMLSNNGLYRD